MQQLISDIAVAHGLDFEHAHCLIERAASNALSAIMQVDGYACLSDKALRFYRFDPDRGEVEIHADDLHRRVIRRLRYEIEQLISSEVAAGDLLRARRLLHKLVDGRVRAFSSSGVHASLDIPGGGTVTAFCPAHALHPKDALRYGVSLKWYVSRVNVRQGKPPRLDIMLSRKSKEFVACLLREKIELLQEHHDFSVTRRIAGQFTEIETRSFIPPFAIQGVARELGERIKIKTQKGK